MLSTAAEGRPPSRANRLPQRASVSPETFQRFVDTGGITHVTASTLFPPVRVKQNMRKSQSNPFSFSSGPPGPEPSHLPGDIGSRLVGGESRPTTQLDPGGPDCPRL